MLFGPTLMLGGIVEFAKSAVAVLIAILAIYLAIRLLGKVAKFVVTIVIVVALFYFLSTTITMVTTNFATLPSRRMAR